MATTMVTTHYAHAPQQSLHYGYVPPPSPPMDETAKCSLPSISNLLGLADQGSPTSETSPQSQQQPQTSKPETRPNSSHYGNPTVVRTALPPSPPMSSDASFEGYNSPSTRSVSQVSNGSNYYFEATPPLGPMEADARQMAPAAAVPRVSVQASAYQTQFAGPTYIGQPAMTSYYPPMQAAAPQPQMSGLYYQRPLPQAFPPPLPVSVTLAPTGGANPWQHHHYIAPSSAASFPQSQDRYICQTCNKAFSRPSSLRIHSHSHTGEKPFKCPFPGCGKAFSVRSNMKRHERGCHNFDSSSSSSSSAGSSGSRA
ncbi:C2H2 finger domain transcription factor mtfA [Madurella fahalii]|uniref:C2H2 finger domain transcription factor mtfA n=1 Tax=Madurella fahalii TaxID=1157608 RepID=A0ABQ0G1R1_9PEZI